MYTLKVKRSIDLEKLFGLLLGYPSCCVEQFLNQSGWGRRSIKGFVPCDAHCSIEDVSTLLGRSPEDEPAEFLEFLKTELGHKQGLEVYNKYGKEDFFTKCWKEAS